MIKPASDLTGRSGVIRTLDPHVPNVVRYQTALHSVTSGVSIEQLILRRKRLFRKMSQGCYRLWTVKFRWNFRAML